MHTNDYYYYRLYIISYVSLNGLCPLYGAVITRVTRSPTWRRCRHHDDDDMFSCCKKGLRLGETKGVSRVRQCLRSHIGTTHSASESHNTTNTLSEESFM